MFTTTCDKGKWKSWSFRDALSMALLVADDDGFKGDVEIRDDSGLVLKLYRTRQS